MAGPSVLGAQAPPLRRILGTRTMNSVGASDIFDEGSTARPRLHPGHPTLCLHDDQVVYLMTMEDHQDDKASVLAIDMRRNMLQGVAKFTADRVPGFTLYCLRVSKYGSR